MKTETSKSKNWIPAFAGMTSESKKTQRAMNRAYDSRSAPSAAQYSVNNHQKTSPHHAE